jgi:hypothetical protein
MSRVPRINNIKTIFIDKVNSSSNFFQTMHPFATSGYDGIHGYEGIHPKQAEQAISLAFLNVVTQWEDFVEACFIRYMNGASSPNGFHPSLRIGKTQSIQHSYEVLSLTEKFDITQRYLTWSPWKVVSNKAKLFFDQGKPFTDLTHQESDRLNDSFVIRNRIAHSSQKAKNEFSQISKQHLGKSRLHQGFTVGQLLLTKDTRGFPRKPIQEFFIHYMQLFLKLADTIAP